MIAEVPPTNGARPNIAVRIIQSVTGPWTRANLVSWLVLITAVLFIKGCILDQYRIPSSSMEPTLMGDPRF